MKTSELFETCSREYSSKCPRQILWECMNMIICFDTSAQYEEWKRIHCPYTLEMVIRSLDEE